MPNYVALKKYVVTYRDKVGNMTAKTANATGTDDRAVKASFEARGYHVLSVVYQGFAGGSVQVG